MVTVLVPEHLSTRDAKLLAERIAVCRILATCDNPDAPEDGASADYAEKCSETAQASAEQDWDRCEIHSVGGHWNSVFSMTKRYVLYDFDADELATVQVYDTYSEAADDASQLDNVIILTLPFEMPTE